MEDAWLSNFGCNPLENFSAYNIEAYEGYVLEMHLRISELSIEAATLQSARRATKGPDERISLKSRLGDVHRKIEQLRIRIADSGTAKYTRLSDREKPLQFKGSKRRYPLSIPTGREQQ